MDIQPENKMAPAPSPNKTAVRPGGRTSTTAYTVTVTERMDAAAVDVQLETIAEALDALSESVDGLPGQGVQQAASDLWEALEYRKRNGE